MVKALVLVEGGSYQPLELRFFFRRLCPETEEEKGRYRAALRRRRRRLREAEPGNEAPKGV